MNRRTHNLAGAASGAGLGLAAGWPWWQTLAAAGLASLTSDGLVSPDGDQYRGWRRMDALLPDEWLGRGGPFQHRGVSHWWGVPAVAALAVWLLVPAAWQWPAWALVVGWTSHLAGDFVHGRRVWGQDGCGIPLGPWFWHFGVGLKSGGVVERWLVAPMLVVALVGEAWLVVAH